MIPSGLVKAHETVCLCAKSQKSENSAILWLLSRVHNRLESDLIDSAFTGDNLIFKPPKWRDQESEMMLVDGRIRMSDQEWQAFQRMNWAPWRPRRPAEFNAICELAKVRHEIENTDGMGGVYALATEKMKFGPNNEVNFPEDKRRLAAMKTTGTWLNDEQLAAFEAAAPAGPGLTLVSSQ